MNDRAKPWPNKQGWDVDDDGEVGQLKDGLEVRVFTKDCKIQFLFIPDLSFDPVKAVERCKKEGTILEQ